ncbi:thiolase [Sphingomonas koreensis]|jgi:acetyl-CoA acetyltransferase|uniref:Thiolase n=1 Tax=Sphingomonas koreensis TaxID=93064 RepID=A0A1L6J548_9SPHN|nr:thiolase [Sphingomonas koreensis]APR51072.1 thiolase [Sphingomonas koreensis]MDC7810644.1 thiolase [Sphingomonas koreensis]RSU17175.1 thiolase [Sphingomonas koreensis]RSU19516.1 thiolase [Sphingomonas koreensis]RSU20923.1 thiolase [Sphingomonas koreensis]
MSFPRGRTAVVGSATFGMGSAPGYTAAELLAKASLAAIADAGLKPSDIDGVFAMLPQDPFCAMSVPEYLGIRPKIVESTRTGGSAFQIHAMWAALALEAGLCDAVLIAYGSNQRSASGGLVSSGAAPFPYEQTYKPRNPPSSYALAAARHMHEYGTTREHLAEVAVAARKWAQLNPDAFARDSLTIEDVLAARMVSDPLTVRDCCLVTDGAAAIVMTRADRARDLPQPPVYLLGAASATWFKNISEATDLTVTAASEAGARAYEQAGVKPSDIDIVELYDAFTINTILFLEDLGFCPKGEGGRFVADGGIAPGGRLPVNTNGGGLSCVHPGMYGLFTMVEAVTQLRGQAGTRQVADAKLALAHGNGGTLSSQSVTIFGTTETL